MRMVDVRKLALSLPEATEEPHFDLTSFRVRGKIFATVPPGEGVVRVFVDEDETRAAVAEDPDAFFEVWWGKRLAGLGVRVAKVRRAELRELLEEAWRRKAPKKLVRELDR